MLQATSQDEHAAELIQAAFLHLLDDSPGWEEIYAHTARVLPQIHSTYDAIRIQQERIRHLITEELTGADMAGQSSEEQTNHLVKTLTQVEKVCCKSCNSWNKRDRF